MSFKPLLLAALLGCISPVFAASAQSDLSDIRQAISAAQSDLRQKQAAQKSAQQTLNKTRAALDKARQELAAINQKQRNAWQKLQRLQSQLDGLKTEVSGTKAQVARLLSAHYRNRQPNAVMLFLQNADVGQKARFLQYSRYINQANEQVINHLEQQQKELSQQEAAIDAEVARLNKLKAQKQAALAKLGSNHSAAQSESNKLSAQINNQSQRLAKLKADEQRLNQLLADMARKETEKRKREAAAQAKAAQVRIEAANKARAEQAKKGKATADKAASKNVPKTNTPKLNSKPSAPAVRSTLTAEDRLLNAPEATQMASNSFGRMQGRLSRPTSGAIIGRFGQVRESGGTWKGVFFANSGAAVRSIYAGTVIFAGNMPSYGNMVVISHGDGYATVYAGLGSIAVRGGRVATGQTVGTSGQLPSGERGLYLEVRSNSAAVNPLSWIR